MNFLIEHWPTILAILGYIGAPLAFIFGRKKAIAETRITQTDAIKNMQSAYDGWVTDDKQRYESINSELKEVKKEMTLQRKENYQQREEIRALRKAMEASKKREQEAEEKYSELEKKYNSLKAAFERLKRKYPEKTNQTPSDGN